MGSICYSHADNASLVKLQRLHGSTLRQPGLSGIAIDSMATRHKVAYYTSMLYKQVVLGEGQGFIRAHFPNAPQFSMLMAHAPTWPGRPLSATYVSTPSLQRTHDAYQEM